jgi:nitrite reductase/ring-hydroxylating ferredoxin subunit
MIGKNEENDETLNNLIKSPLEKKKQMLTP